ncbi:MAG TPA: hypothetical protein VK163_08870 [Opitutaceae bacterium]|nr:hypothetical protein [Opitutaceae bacterium]
MIKAIYRRRGSHEELEFEFPGNEIDCTAIDAAAERQIGVGWRRMASWISNKSPAGKKAPVG